MSNQQTGFKRVWSVATGSPPTPRPGGVIASPFSHYAPGGLVFNVSSIVAFFLTDHLRDTVQVTQAHALHYLPYPCQM